jgi:hypothetical protein
MNLSGGASNTPKAGWRPFGGRRRDRFTRRPSERSGVPFFAASMARATSNSVFRSGAPRTARCRPCTAGGAPAIGTGGSGRVAGCPVLRAVPPGRSHRTRSFASRSTPPCPTGAQPVHRRDASLCTRPSPDRTVDWSPSEFHPHCRPALFRSSASRRSRAGSRRSRGEGGLQPVPRSNGSSAQLRPPRFVDHPSRSRRSEGPGTAARAKPRSSASKGESRSIGAKAAPGRL